MTTQQNGNDPTALGTLVAELVSKSVPANGTTRQPKSLDSERLAEFRAVEAAKTPEQRESEARQRAAHEAARLQEAELSQKRQEAFKTWQSTIAKIGKRYADVRLTTFTVADPRQAAAIERLKDLADCLPEHCAKGGGLVFIGPMGTGKDHLAVAMLFEAASRHAMTIGWCDGQSLFQDFRDRIGDDRREEDSIKEMATPDVILISDPIPQSGTVTEFQQSILWRIIDRRYRNCKPTWVTMNVANSEEAEKRLGAQIVDRLRDGAVNIVCNWGSYRKAAQIGWKP